VLTQAANLDVGRAEKFVGVRSETGELGGSPTDGVSRALDDPSAGTPANALAVVRRRNPGGALLAARPWL
jgi:hypothetical protein